MFESSVIGSAVVGFEHESPSPKRQGFAPKWAGFRVKGLKAKPATSPLTDASEDLTWWSAGDASEQPTPGHNWPFFTSEPVRLGEFMAKRGIAGDVIEAATELAKFFEGMPPVVQVVRDAEEENSDHVSIRMPTSMRVSDAYGVFELFLERFWAKRDADAIVIDLEFV